MRINFVVLAIVVILTFFFWNAMQDQLYDNKQIVRIAFIGPMSGDGAAAGKLMTQGINLYLDELNRDRKNNVKFKLDIFDDKNSCSGEDSAAKKEAMRIVEENKVLAVIGHWYSSCSITGGKVYKKYGIPAITPGSVKKEVTENNQWYFRNIYSASTSGQFLAYYVKTVLGLDKVTIIHDDSGYGQYLASVFEQSSQDLNIDITYKWDFKSSDNNKQQFFTDIVQQIKNNHKSAGAILLATQAGDGISLVKQIKDQAIPNYIISGSGFSEQTFVNGFDQFPKEKANAGYYTNDIYVATPLIFDTANEQAQKFREEYQQKDHKDPDWSAAYAYDSALVLANAIKQAKITGTPKTIKQDRQKIRDILANYTNIHDAIEGTTGFNYFDENRDAQKPVTIGVYKNKQLVSALTQFQVMRNPNEVADLQTAIKEGYVLKIGNQFMYKTNVVYTGLKINEIGNIDDDLTFKLDFHIWFRSGNHFNPQNIEFLNAVDPDELKFELIEEKEIEQMSYRLYRVNGNFRADFFSNYFAYKQHTLSVNFHHKTLTRNNLIYVTDILGMGDHSFVLESMRKGQVLSPTTGWSIDQIRFFQDTAKKNSLGNPEYLNAQGGTVEYSRFNTDVQIKKNELTLRGKLTYQYAYYLLIISSIGILLLKLAARKIKGISKLLWFFQTIIAFILLLATEVALINWLAENVEMYNIKVVIKFFDIMWWIIPAFLLNSASENFIWIPVEEKTKRQIPNIVRLFLAFIIYFFAFIGIIAFVYEQQLTSILATSGVIAMIIGLAIQINISNIFSGIAINIEKPFRLGDWVKIGEFEEGEIVDITWRTTRLKTRKQCILSIPNSVASESPILNYCYPNNVYWLWPTVYVHPMHPPARVKKILQDALLSANQVLNDPEPVVIMTGINEWAATYWIAFCADDYANKYFILEDVWMRVWFHLNRAGIAPAVQRQEVHLFKGIKERGGEEATKPVTLLNEVDIFKPFSEEAKNLLSERIRRHRFGPGDVIVQQGNVGDSLFIIVEGVVGVRIKTNEGNIKEIARLGAGNFFGEMALLTGEDRTATVVSIVDTYLYELTKDDIKPLLAKQPEASELISKVLTRRQMATQSAKQDIKINVEIEQEAIYKKFLGKIELFFGLKEGT